MYWFWQFPKIRFVMALIMAAGAVVFAGILAYGMVGRWQEDRDTPDEPVPIALQDAIEKSKTKDDQWVALKDTGHLRWDCNSIVHWNEKQSGADWMDVVVTDPAQTVVIVVVLRDPMTCEELLAAQPPLRGNLSPLKGRDFDDKNFEGRLSRYPQTATFLNLCTYCDPNNSAPALVAGGLFAVGLLAFAAWLLRVAVRARREFQPQDDTPPPAQIVMLPARPLAQAFEFTAADLAENAAGRLSQRQFKQMTGKLHWLVGLAIIEAFGLGLVALGATGVAGGNRTGWYIVGGAIAFVGGPILGVMDGLSRRALSKGQVLTLCGRVTLATRRVLDSADYWATINETDFTLNETQYQALTDGAAYCFYYVTGVFGGYRGKRRVVSVQESRAE